MNVEQYLDALIKREGGYVNDALDSGQAANLELLKQLHVAMDIKVKWRIYL